MSTNKKSQKSFPHKGKPMDKKAAYSPAKKHSGENLIIGVIEGNAKGFAFLIVEGQAEDLFIPANAMNGAMHRDVVEAVITGHRRGAGEAEVVRVVKKGLENIVGTFSENERFGFVIPDDRHISRDIFISKNNFNGAKNGDKVVIKISASDPLKKPEGYITEVLGAPTDKGTDILSIIRAYNLYEEFPSPVIKEASACPTKVLESDLTGRRDFRADAVFTIDGDDSRDFDDAVGVIINEKGNYVLSVHIADVTHYVKAKSPLDTEAYKRGTSVYFVDRVLPMLPKELSNGICSLNEGEDRLTLSCIMEIDKSGNVVSHEIVNGVINSAARMTYNQVAKILSDDEELIKRYSELVPSLRLMEQLANKLMKLRFNRGSIEFDLTESKIILGDDGKVKEVVRYERLISHKIIEEFMLKANEVVAQDMQSKKTPFVYRSHLSPPSEKVENLIGFLEPLGIVFKYKDEPTPLDFSLLLGGLKEEIKPIVSKVTLRTMSKATYEPTNNGHFGLAAEFYCHFTSPIRRYPDLIIHRIIKDYLTGGMGAVKKYEAFTAEAAKRSSERERLAEMAERDVDDLKKAEYMADHIGEVFKGNISGVTEFGIFVELENSIEGLVRTENLIGDGYELNSKLMRLSNSHNSYAFGDNITIVVQSVSGDRVNFALYGKEDN